jgi:hypothetical protein
VPILIHFTGISKPEKLKALAAGGFVWRLTKESDPSIFFSFYFLHFEADDFRAFGFDFLKAPKYFWMGGPYI